MWAGWQKFAEDLSWREMPVSERLSHSMVKGIDKFIEEMSKNFGNDPAGIASHRRPVNGWNVDCGDLFEQEKCSRLRS